MKAVAVRPMAATWVGTWVIASATLAAFAASAASAVPAADFSLGASAGTGQGRVDCVASFPCKRRSANFKLYAGHALTEAVELRAVYFNAGRFKGGGTTLAGTPPAGLEFGGAFKVSGVGITAGYRWDITPLWSVAVHAGLASVRTRFEHANPAFGSVSQTAAQPLAGMGLAYAATPALRLGIDFDSSRFKAHTTRGPLHMLGLSAQFSF